MSLRPRFLIGTTVLLLLGLALVYIVGRLEPYTETLEHGEVVLSFPAAELPAKQAQLDELLSV